MLKETAQAILEEPVKLVITEEKRHPVFFWKKRTISHQFELKPLNLGTITKISSLVLEIDPDFLKKTDGVIDFTYKSANQHGRALALIVAIAIVNRKQDPPESLVTLIENNLTPRQLAEVFGIILKNMDVTAFMSSIISIRGVNLLKKMNPADQGSQIASGAQSVE